MAAGTTGGLQPSFIAPATDGVDAHTQELRHLPGPVFSHLCTLDDLANAASDDGDWRSYRVFALLDEQTPFPYTYSRGCTFARPTPNELGP